MKQSAPRLVLVLGDSGFTEETENGDEYYDNTQIVKSRVSGFSRGKPEAGRNELGLCTARYESNCC